MGESLNMVKYRAGVLHGFSRGRDIFLIKINKINKAQWKNHVNFRAMSPSPSPSFFAPRTLFECNVWVCLSSNQPANLN